MGRYGCCKEDWTVFRKKEERMTKMWTHVLFDSTERRKENGGMQRRTFWRMGKHWIMIGSKSRVSCRNPFRRLEFLPFVSQYILSRMLFVVKNKNLFILNSENHTKSTRQFNNLYQPITNLTIYQREVYYMDVKIFSNLPWYIKDISNNIRKFEICLKRYLHIHSFYSIERAIKCL